MMLQADLERSRYNQVLNVLRMRVIDIQSTSRQELKINTLADELNVSATPIREALIQLVGEKYVELEHHKGFFVPKFTATTLRSKYEFIELLLEFEALFDSDKTYTLAQKFICSSSQTMTNLQRCELLETIYQSLFDPIKQKDIFVVLIGLLWQTRKTRLLLLNDPEFNSAIHQVIGELSIGIEQKTLENAIVLIPKLMIDKKEMVKKAYASLVAENFYDD